MKHKRLNSDRNPYLQGGTILIVLSVLCGLFVADAYFNGLPESVTHGLAGTQHHSETPPKGFGSIIGFLYVTGLGLTGIILWIIGLIKKLRTRA